MEKKRYIYWQDENMWLGYFEEYPDYWTQGETIEELKANLRDIHHELESGNIPCVRKVVDGFYMYDGIIQHSRSF